MLQEVDGIVIVASSALDGQHCAQLAKTAMGVTDEWMRQRYSDSLPQEMIEWLILVCRLSPNSY